MLSIGKIGSGKGAGSATYYTRSVADGAEDYYLGRGEAPGYWAGTATDQMGLHGPVESDAFMALTEGRNPATGQALYSGRTRTVQAIDATFSAPKSVSLMYALGDPVVRDHVLEAHDAAVASGLDYLQDHACYSRAGRNGIERIEGQGFAAAVFRHRTSRAGDPQLHSHVVIANMTADADGTWRTLDGRALYGEAKTAGTVYQASLRMELTQRLGLEFDVTPSGLSEIRSFDRSWIDAFSQRSAEIRTEMAEHGMSTWGEAELAAHRTRQPKTRGDARSDVDGIDHQRDYGVDPNSIYGQWRARARDLGLTPDRLDSYLGAARYRQPTGRELADIAETMAGPDGLTRQASTFTRREVVQAFARGVDQGLDREAIERVADAFLAGDDILPTLEPNPLEATRSGITVGDTGQRLPVHPDERRYTTVEMLHTERAVIDAATTRSHTDVAVLDPDRVGAFLDRHPGIKEDQAQTLRHVTTSGNGVDVIQAHAGTGKTWTLGRINEVYLDERRPVIGLTAARTAVTEMTNEGIDAYTIAQYLWDSAYAPGEMLPREAVVLIDEAGMISTRDWARLMPTFEQAQAKVIVCGDTGQLPEIDAGGVFRGLQQRLGSAELNEVIRQRDPDEIAALDAIRLGNVGEAIEFYQGNDRVIVSPRAADVRAQMAHDYMDATSTLNPETGQPNAVMTFAPRREQVSALNLEIREHMTAAGRLTGDVLVVPTKHDGPQPFQIGDQIRPTANWNARGIINNDFGTVTAIDHDAGSITFQPHRPDAMPVELPAGYLAQAKVDYGYARTVHGAQGATCDIALTMGDLSVYNEMFYTQMSRARHEVRVYATAPPPTIADTIDSPMGSGPPDLDPLDDLVRAATQSRGKTLALDAVPSESPETLAAERRRLRDSLSEIPRDQTPTIERLQHELDTANGRARQAGQDLRQIGPPQPGEPAAATARRSQLLDEIERHTDRITDLEPRLTTARSLQAQRESLVEHHAGDIDRYRHIRQHLNAEIRYRVTAHEARPARYIVETLGPRPDSPAARSTWRQGVTAIERHRVEWGVNDPELALGKRSTIPGTSRSAWDVTSEQISKHRREMGRVPKPLLPTAADGRGLRL